MSNRSKANRPIHVLDLPGCDVGAIKGAINRWKKDSINAARLKEDRARPTYRTLMDMHADGPSD